MRVNTIIAKDYKWIYDAFINEEALEKVNPKLLRALLSRTYKLIRTDIPKRSIEIDYATLESALEDSKEINKIFGITNISNPSAFNIAYPYTLTDVAKELGYDNWNHANDLLNRVSSDKGINIKSSDNKYHIMVKTGKNSCSRKYSQECIQLLKRVDENDDYDVNL